ncbi:glycoside hydrolase family 3 N-terminal domain-containing protein [Amnibacterium kyonggiense]|uniref:Beta-N-acetylhexosaminidase n=1 Tax=Amnibacterium kyonggiense TaxID=595671 RepID=A0A4R7FLA7_9MICO|nr:glycoside hydrolase family 3 protein [Amnibacterium kyonggiense]TDS77175.1 beta-N-acetylhexosaminidase [Amnibacterium kyonggiense]
MTAELRRLAAGTLLPGFAGTALSDGMAARFRDGLAGVALFGRNIESVEQVRALTDAIRAIRPEAVVAIDEEGGDVTRLHLPTGSPEPGNAVLGRIDDEAVTAASAHRIGEELVAAGVNLDLAPSVDANTDADNPVIGARSFGADPALVARHGAAWIRALQSTGVAACAKHFPGHGDTAVDSHLGLPVVDQPLDVLLERELPPFVAAIEAGVATVMTSHILLPRLDPDAPATMSRAILTGLLRERLGFTGVVVTDALDMAGASAAIGIPAAAVRSLAAGADLLCLGSDSEPHLDAVLDAIVAAVASGELAESRLRDAADRVRRLNGRAEDGGSAPAPLGAERIATAFDVSASAAAALATPGPWTVVRLEDVPNLAVGPAGWGPFTALDDAPAAQRFAAWPRLEVGTDDPVPEVSGRVLVIGRDVHRRPRSRAVVDALRAAGGTVVVVDMGWPSADRRYADIATFGSSRAVGAALLPLLSRPEGP